MTGSKKAALRAKYPDGIKFDAEGFPDFSPYADKTTTIEYTGTRAGDYAAADKAAGITEEYRKIKGLTWHHVEDMTTMQLVPTDLHSALGHTGGFSLAQIFGDIISAAPDILDVID